MISLNDWKPADCLILEPNALAASQETHRNLVLTAGPGAGKTEVLAQRADFLLRTGICQYPRRILAISFKVDASKNLKDRVRCRCGGSLAARFDSYTFHAFAKHLIACFRPVLTGHDALDIDYQIGHKRIPRRQIEFEDLITLATKILVKSAIARKAIRMTYSDVFLDEFQDCTKDQYELLKLAFHGTSIRLTAVGDAKQKIMGWAGALDKILKIFADDFSARPLNLYRNFRSKSRLLRMQNAIIRIIDPTSYIPDSQIPGEDGELYQWKFEDSKQEAKYLAKSISSWIEQEHIPPSEIAILIPKQPDLYGEELTEELERINIPYRDEQKLQDLSAEPVAKLIVDYLSVLYGQREPEAWCRLMNQLTPFGDDDDSRQHNSVNYLQNFIQEQRRILRSNTSKEESVTSYWDFACRFLREVGLETLSSLSHDYESKDRLRQIATDTRTRINELLEGGHSVLDALKLFSNDNAVRIMTIHKSKGLEFDTVILLGVEAQTFWAEKNEERRGFFVGVSRAKRRLILTVSNRRQRPQNANKWYERRTPHSEFLGYAAPFLCMDK